MELVIVSCIVLGGLIGYALRSLSKEEKVSFEYMQSELSSPKKKRTYRIDTKLNIALLHDFICLEQKHWPMCTKFFARLTPKYSSHGQRLSDLRKDGYLKAEKWETEYGKRHIYSFTDKWFDLAFNNK